MQFLNKRYMHQRIKTAIVSEVHTSTMRWNPWRITTRGRWMPLRWNFRTIVAVIMESDICNKRMWIYPAWGIFISFKIYTKQVDTWLHIATYPFYCIVSRISLYIKYLNTRYSIHLWTYNGYAMIKRMLNIIWFSSIQTYNIFYSNNQN